jgi:hypothetical protein
MMALSIPSRRSTCCNTARPVATDALRVATPLGLLQQTFYVLLKPMEGEKPAKAVVEHGPDAKKPVSETKASNLQIKLAVRTAAPLAVGSCAGNGLTPPTSAGTDAYPSHICTGTGLTPPTSAP